MAAADSASSSARVFFTRGEALRDDATAPAAADGDSDEGAVVLDGGSADAEMTTLSITLAVGSSSGSGASSTERTSLEDA